MFIMLQEDNRIARIFIAIWYGVSDGADWTRRSLESERRGKLPYMA